MTRKEGSRRCTCQHEPIDHFEIAYFNKESTWPCSICLHTTGGCMDFKMITNLQYLKDLYDRKTL